MFSDYDSAHTHPVNRALHMVAIPLGFSSVFFLRKRPKVALALIPSALGLAWLGHLIEGSDPAFIKNPSQVFVAPVWMARRVFGRKRQSKAA